jgi:tetratricopeptide (TPR) repeat protein
MNGAGDRIASILAMLSAEPDDVFLNYALGLEHIKAGNAEEAKKWLTRSLKLDPGYFTAHYQLGKLAERENDHASAMQWYQTGLEIARQKGQRKAVSEFEEAIFLLED